MNLSTRLYLLLFLIFSGLGQLAAQESSRLSGQVKDNNGERLPFANITLIEAATDKLVTGTVSDEEGKFSFTTSQTGSFRLKVSSIGYQSFTSDAFSLKAGANKDFGILKMEEEVASLNEVTVKAVRPTVTIEADKTVVNIEGTVMAEGSTALDVIGRSPGIYVDADGNINLNGRSGVMVMIDDRQTYMSATELATFLRAMPADNIKSIEIINNPGARFDAEGSAGVINIKLKKNNLDGINGSIQAGSRYNGLYAPSTGASLNVKKGKWTSNARINYNHWANQNNLNIQRNFQLEEGISEFNQKAILRNRNKNLFFTGGTDYDINQKHSVGMSLQASRSANNSPGSNLTALSNPGQDDTNFVRSLNDNESERERVFANFHYVGKLDTLGTKLTSDVDYTRMTSGSQSILTNTYWLNEAEEQATRNRIRTINAMDYSILTAKADFTKPFGKGKVLETGLKGSWVHSDNDLDLSKSVSDEGYVRDPNSNHFIYQENVLAAYASFKGSISPKLSYQAGLRTEYSDITGNSVTMNEVNKQKYLDLFPSMYLQHQVSENYQIIYNANRRINRPNYRLLNPFVEYIDPLVLEQGNPYLKPEYAHNLEMTHVIKGAYQLSASYSQVRDDIQQVFMQDEATRTTTLSVDNLDKAENFNLKAMIPFEIASWWNTNNMAQLNHNKYKSYIGDALLDVAQTSYMFRSQHNLLLPAGFKLELVGMFLGPQREGQMWINSFGWVDAGLTRSMMDDKMTITLNGTDLFRTQVIRGNINFDKINTNFSQYRSNQGISLTLRYNFSSGESFKVTNRSGSTEEQDRL